MAGEVVALDSALARSGTNITLRRVIGAAPNLINIDVDARAMVRAASSEEIAGGIAMTDSIVIISPTEIANAQWPGGELPSVTVVNPSLPRANDKCIIEGRVRNILAPVKPIYIGDELVRIELRVAG